MSTEKKETIPDAGVRALTHYQRRMPPWRFELRRSLIPLVRWETPYIAKFQATCRTSVLDAYFAFTANLGTHTFFMTALPICYWCGYPDTGQALVRMLAAGVYLSGFSKDLLCLPRPLSPPLQRITMSGSAALEYGFPSTHTTNAVSVAIYSLYKLHVSRPNLDHHLFLFLNVLCYLYAFSISIGRVYCGMHGFFDVGTGAALGALIGLACVACGSAFDSWILTCRWVEVALVVAALVVAVRIYPEPADSCPCFDDSVSFLGVMIGTEVGAWHYAKHLTWTHIQSDTPLAQAYSFANQNPFKVTTRVVGGIMVVFAWRAITKPLLLRWLPPIFRLVDQVGVRLPRRHFLHARDYTSVPTLRKDDNVLPPASEIPAMISQITSPRKRTVSVGPQSEADAREYVANLRERRSRGQPVAVGWKQVGKKAEVNNSATLDTASPLGERSSIVKGEVDPAIIQQAREPDNPEVDEDREVFSFLKRARIRYDAEVITKLIVYAGIGWLATEGNPVWFSWLGLV
ncbi:hypothetical protein K470DRAFT_257335 [Piedraia hortae CBS 480.64]|uniref:Phosphatidic acid phosphatase type 2/haloperoxidase domain-containing protein n=1 Tax=Piedraia hortae CBS 480.64 TaxID=1314780 RepID=A0A6A7C2Q8_9PEZI|nr:hypothetical protein K470DRAFT_257335 [Piedraia hortae CBS 480.64]